MGSPHPHAHVLVLDDKYRLDGLLGAGAVGDVHRATHLRLGKAFALKLLKPGSSLDPFSRARFQREAEALGRLRHPNIVAVTDFGLDPGTGAPYLVLELLEGVPLSRVLERGGPLPLERALPVLDGIAAAVDAAHEAGILHRDLKPGNILLCGEEDAVKVLDFGLAEISAAPLREAGRGRKALQEASLTATDDLLGTPLYIAPEVIGQGRAERASDLYSLAVIAYELLAGGPPFQGSTMEVLRGHLEEEPERREPLSPEIWEALRPALAKDPALRPATARELVQRLRNAAGRERTARWKRAEIPRRILLSATLALLPLGAGLLPPLPALERWTHDLRLLSAPPVPPDPRILLVTLDEDSLAGSPVPFAARADEVGDTLDRIFAAGARGVAVDLVLPDSWSGSPGFSSLVLHHPDDLVLAAFSTPDGKVLGAGGVSGLTAAALGPRSADLFGFVNLDEDQDGMVRRGRTAFRDRAGGERPSWAAKAAGLLLPVPGERVFWIDHRIDPAGFPRISWRDVPAALSRRPWIFQDRLVLLGGDLEAAGDDVQRVPGQDAIPGLMLQARQVSTLLAGTPVREPRPAPFLIGAALWSGLAAAAALLSRRPGPALAALSVLLALYLGLSFPVFRSTGLLLPVALPLPPALGALALALTLRRALSPIPRRPKE